jgi:serralysin
MSGGLGNDVFFVDSLGDAVTELTGQGTDLVRSSIASGIYTLAANVENLLLDSGNVVAIGNGLNNSLTGNGENNQLGGNGGNDTLSGLVGNDGLFGGIGNDALDGGAGNDNLLGQAGNDTMTGGAGQDTFWFTTALDPAANVDTITDFAVADDTIRLESDFFAGLANGPLAASALRIGATAADVDDRIIYDDATGALLFDADGSGAGAPVQFATLATGLALTAADFLVV